MGYYVTDLCLLPALMVPFSRLPEVDVKPGEIVIVAPATGRYGGAAVAVDPAMEATVVAAGRNSGALRSLESIDEAPGRLRTVVLTGDPARNPELSKTAAETPKGADVYLDFSPPAMQGGVLPNSGIGALRSFGRCILMGEPRED